MKIPLKPLLCAVGTMLIPSLPLSGMDEPAAIAASELPPAVTKTIRQSFPGAEVLSVARDDSRNDYVYYLVQIKQAGENKQVEIAENGTVSKTEAAGK